MPLTALGKARGAMRLQKGPQGTPLNLIPRFIAVPTALETYMLQLVYPINIASADATEGRAGVGAQPGSGGRAASRCRDERHHGAGI